VVVEAADPALPAIPRRLPAPDVFRISAIATTPKADPDQMRPRIRNGSISLPDCAEKRASTVGLRPVATVPPFRSAPQRITLPRACDEETPNIRGTPCLDVAVIIVNRMLSVAPQEDRGLMSKFVTALHFSHEHERSGHRRFTTSALSGALRCCRIPKMPLASGRAPAHELLGQCVLPLLKPPGFRHRAPSFDSDLLRAPKHAI